MSLDPDLATRWWTTKIDDSTYYMQNVCLTHRICVVFCGSAFQHSLLCDGDGFLIIQNSPRTTSRSSTTIVTLTPEQAMQNADRWWDAASKLPSLDNVEPLETPSAP